MIALPADLYDRIEASARQWGGIGAGFFTVFTSGRLCPFCAHGHVMFTGSGDRTRTTQYDQDRLSATGLTIERNDRIVEDAIGYNHMTRISWTEYCRVGEIVREEAPSSC